MFCSKCGAENADSARFCCKCGESLTPAPASGDAGSPKPQAPATGGVRQARKVYAQGKNPVLALVMSLLIVGLGQFYNGDAKKGALMLVGGVVGGIVTLTLAWWGMAIWSAIDAHQVASGKTPLWI